MQSTVFSSSNTQQGTVESLNDLLRRDAVKDDLDDFESQCETSNRMPVLSGISYAQQERRMRKRPLSLAGVEVAQDNRFQVFSDALAVTCNHPSIFSALKGGLTDTLSGIPTLVGEKISTQKQTLELGFDFANRSWPAYEPALSAPVCEPAPWQEGQESLIGWNMSARKPRISAVHDRVPSTIANLDSLRKIVDKARDRDAQRITAKLRAISPRRSDDKIGQAIDATKTAVAKVRFQCHILGTYLSHANNRENFTLMQ